MASAAADALQRKIFSRWCNQKLWMSRHIKVTDIVTDLQNDPTILLSLIEVLSEKTFTGKIDKSIKMRMQKISTTNIILKYVYEDCGVQMKIKTSAEDIADGAEKAVLGLVFQILLKFMKIGDEEGPQLNAKDALLMWIQNKVAGYKDVSVTNFTNSFHSGLALCALLHKHRPQLIKYESLNKDCKMDNLKTAMVAAEKYFGLEQYISPADVLKLDENGMMVYVSEFYYGIAEQRKIDQAARRIHKVIKFTKTCDALRAEFAKEAKEFKERVAKVEKILEDRTIDNTMAGARKKIDEFYAYKTQDKNVIMACQLALEGVFNNLSMLLANNKRPEFVPPAGLSLKDIEATVHHLEQVEQERKVALHAELNRQIRLAKQAEHHELLFNKLSAWVAAKEAYLGLNEPIESVGAAQLALRTLDVLVEEHTALLSGTAANLKKLGVELSSEKYEHTATVQAHEAQLFAALEQLKKHEDARKLVLQDDLAREQFKERVRLQAHQHSERHQKLVAWAEEHKAYLGARESCLSVSAAQLLIQLLAARAEDREETLAGAVAAIKKLGTEVIEAKYATQYSSWVYEKPGEITARHQWAVDTFAALAESHQAKVQYAQDELKRELHKEELRLRFAQQAADVIRWSKDACEDAGLSLFGFTLEEVEAHDAVLAKAEAATRAEMATRLGECNATLAEFPKFGINENPYTTLAQPDLQSADSFLEAALSSRRQRYTAERERQRKNDQLCRDFAAVADPMAQWISATKDKITHSTGKLREQQAFVMERINSMAAEGSALAKIIQLQAQLDQAGVANNRHTLLTAKDVEVQWKQYENFLDMKRKMLETEIENEERRGITAEQFAEIKENFEKFDADRNGIIDQKELKACLYSLGEELPQAEVAKILAEYGKDKHLSYEGFVKFMLHLFGDTDTKEDVLAGWLLIARGEPVVKEDRLVDVLEGEDVQYIKETAATKDGGYNYTAWTDNVFSR
jgi:Ca2+-binding EF-hand superfamily protein